MAKHQIELSDKELLLVWTIICWFSSPVTSTLKYKFSGLASNPLRKKFNAKFENGILEEMVRNGKWLDNNRDRWENQNG